MSTPPPKQDSAALTSPFGTVTPRPRTLNGLYDATPRARPRHPNTPVLAPVQQRVILEPIETLPSSQEPIAKSKPAAKGKCKEISADEDTESKKTLFFPPKDRVVAQESARISPEKLKGLLEFLKSKNGSGSSKDGDEKIAAFSDAPRNEPPAKHDEYTKLATEQDKLLVCEKEDSIVRNIMDDRNAGGEKEKSDADKLADMIGELEL